MAPRRSEHVSGVPATVAKALRLLNVFVENSPGIGLTEIAALANLPKGTVHRLLIALEEEALVLQDPESRRWGLGFGTARLYQAFREQSSLLQLASPWLQKLRDELQETVCLVIEDSGNAICIARVDPDHELRLHTAVGIREPLHAGAGRKVLMAFLPEERRERIIAEKGLPALTSHTTTDAHQLRRDLAAIRQQGYAITLGEHNSHAAAVAAPIRGSRGRAVASISVAGPATRLTREKMALALPRLLEACRQVSRQLGFRESPVTTNGGGSP